MEIRQVSVVHIQTMFEIFYSPNDTTCTRNAPDKIVLQNRRQNIVNLYQRICILHRDKYIFIRISNQLVRQVIVNLKDELIK